MEISKLLVLSTAHITENTTRQLENTPSCDWPMSGGEYSEYGWFMRSGFEDRPVGLPDDLWKLFVFAKDQGCDYLLLDRDGPVLDELPQYDW